MFRALDFSPTLSRLLLLACGQAVFRRVHTDFGLSLTGRSPVRPRLLDRYRASAEAAS